MYDIINSALNYMEGKAPWHAANPVFVEDTKSSILWLKLRQNYSTKDAVSVQEILT